MFAFAYPFSLVSCEMVHFIVFINYFLFFNLVSLLIKC